MPPERRMTDAEMRRKTNKPIMEKKRRERINNCLEDLKSIVLKSVSEDSRPNKLEKADILEMTVRYLKSVQTTKPLAIDLSISCNEDISSVAAANDDSDSGAVNQRRAGYEQCVRDVAAYMSHSQDGISPGARTQLLVHLTNRCNSAVEAPRAVKRKRSHPPAPQVQPFPKRLITELDLRRRAQGRVAMDDSGASFGNVTSYLAADVSSSTQNLSLAASPPALHSASPFSPVPVSPISNPSTVSPGAYRQIASPSLSSTSQDSIGDATHEPPCPNTGSLFSPVTPVVERKPRFLKDSAHYHYVSSDSGHWSSGSNPPSPISKTEQASANNGRVLSKGVSIKVENLQQGGMWRPWGL